MRFAKILGLLIVAFIVCVGALFFWLDAKQKAEMQYHRDPAVMQRAKDLIATFDEPLPPGWKFVEGDDQGKESFGTIHISAANQATNTEVAFYSFKPEDKGTAIEELDKWTSLSVPVEELSKPEQIKVANAEFVYKTLPPTKERRWSQIYATAPGSDGKIIGILLAKYKTETPVTIKDAEPLLSHIKAFK